MIRVPTVLLVIGVLCVSVSGIIAHRALQEATPLALAAWRLGLASLVFVAASRFPSGARGLGSFGALKSRERLRLILGGLMLVAHFLTWFASLRLTSVAVATLLCCSTPLWTAIISRLTGRRREGGGFWASLGLAAVGVGLVIQPHGGVFSPRVLLGDLLATAGGLTFSLYLWCIDGLQHIPSQRIVTNTFSAAAAVLWVLLIASRGVTVHYSAPVWEAILLAALIPQIMGHTLLNNALRHFTANTVAFSVLAEPVITAILAHFLLGERISALQLCGGALVLTALGLVLAGGQRAPANPAMAEEL